MLNNLFNNIKNNINLKKYNNIKHLSNILNNYNGDDWKKYRVVNDLSYNKILVSKTENFDIYIITWKEYYESSIHNHSKNGCLYKILEGTLIEDNYNKKLEFIGFKNLNKNAIGYIDDNMSYHNIINPTNQIAVSLHIYSPSDYKTNYFSSVPNKSPNELFCN
jgi:cysteine dioxygenase